MAERIISLQSRAKFGMKRTIEEEVMLKRAVYIKYIKLRSHRSACVIADTLDSPKTNRTLGLVVLGN